MKRIKHYFTVAIVFLFAACSTQKVATVTPPAGIEFTKVENFKGFAVINMPYSGNYFAKNESVNVLKNQNDAGVFVPGVKFENNNLIFKSNINNTEGDIDVQYEVVKKQYLNHLIKDNSIVVYEKKNIAKKNVAFIKLTTKMDNGLIKYSYGYIVPHNNKAALFLINDALIQTDKLQTYNTIIEQAFNYMIKTVEFQEL